MQSDQNGQLLVQRKDITGRWIDYFTNLLNVHRDTPFGRDPDLEIGMEESIEGITDVELSEEISMMKRKKTTGNDHLSVENINTAGEQAQSLMLMQDSYQQEVIIKVAKGSYEPNIFIKKRYSCL